MYVDTKPMKTSVIHSNTTTPATSTARNQHTALTALFVALLFFTSGGCEQLDPHYGEDEYQEYVVLVLHLIDVLLLALMLLIWTMMVHVETDLFEDVVDTSRKIE